MTIANPFANNSDAAAEAEIENPTTDTAEELPNNLPVEEPMTPLGTAMYELMRGKKYSWRECGFDFKQAMKRLKEEKELVRHNKRRGIFKMPTNLNFGDDIIVTNVRRKPEYCVISSQVKFIRFADETGRVTGMDENSNMIRGKYLRHVTQED